MKAIDKRLAALETKESDGKLRHVIMGWGNNLPVTMPPGVKEGDPGVLVIRRVPVDPPKRDAQDVIIAPLHRWEDDDPRYLPLIAEERASKSRLDLATAGARDTLAVKLAAMDRGTEPGVTP